MHPHTFYSSLFETPKRPEVFVLTSFQPPFEPRWRDVIEPCIREDLGLKPVRVDDGSSGDSIIHDILEGIAHARLIIADITSTPIQYGKTEADPRRSANVMWELGIAHVMRTPDEVLIVKSDDHPSIFDLTQFRVFNYDPRDAKEARRVLGQLARDRLRSAQQAVSDHVRRVAASLDVNCISVLFEGAESGILKHASLDRTRGPGLARSTAYSRLLELGLIRTEFSVVTQEMLKRTAKYSEVTQYRVTEFGRAVGIHCQRQMGLVRR
jgi:hypothetical protein